MKDIPSNIDELYLILRKRILDEYYFAGQKLSENVLAKEFNCSRTPIRESLKRLEQDGLVVIRPNQVAMCACIRERTIENSLKCVPILKVLRSGLLSSAVPTPASWNRSVENG